jgi:drug/metabolite transporter (DMT)-like permease
VRAAALLLALAAAASWGIGGILLKKGTNVVSPTTILVVQYALGILLIGGWVAATGGASAAIDHVGRRWPLLLGIVTLQIVGYVCFVVAIQKGGTGSLPTATVVAIAACYPALVAVLSGPMLGERIGWHQAAGIGLVIAGVVLTQIR